MRARHFRGKVLTAALLLAGLGCGGTTVKVEGSVTYADGSPVVGATVNYVPEDGKGQPAVGITDKDGKFRLSTAGKEGVAPGDYKVTVTKQAGDTGGERPNPGADPKDFLKKMQKMTKAEQRANGPLKSSLPEKYAKAVRTPFKEMVPPPGPANLQLDVNPPASK